MTTGALTPLEIVVAVGLLIVLAGIFAVHRINRWIDRPLTDADRFCSAVDQELDARRDEARRRANVARFRAVADEPLGEFDWPERAR